LKLDEQGLSGHVSFHEWRGFSHVVATCPSLIVEDFKLTLQVFQDDIFMGLLI